MRSGNSFGRLNTVLLSFATILPFTTSCGEIANTRQEYRDEIRRISPIRAAAEGLQRLDPINLLRALQNNEFLFVLTAESNGNDVQELYRIGNRKKSAEKIAGKINMAANAIADINPEDEELITQILNQHGITVIPRDNGIEIIWFEADDLLLLKITYDTDDLGRSKILQTTVIDEPQGSTREALLDSGVDIVVVDALLADPGLRFGTTTDFQIAQFDTDLGPIDTRAVLRLQERYIGPDEDRERPVIYTAISDVELNGRLFEGDRRLILDEVVYDVAGYDIEVLQPPITARENALGEAVSFGTITATELAIVASTITDTSPLQMESWTF